MTNIVYLTNITATNIANDTIQIITNALIQIFNHPAIIGLFFGIISFIFTSYLSERKKRKSQSLVGVAIIESFIEEVKTGIIIIEESAKLKLGDPMSPVLMPTESWVGLKTKFDDLLERIILVVKDEEKGFPLKEIRIHTKNYFTNICGNVNFYKNCGKIPNNAQDIIESSKKVLTMLERTRDLLIKNSKQLLPK